MKNSTSSNASGASAPVPCSAVIGRVMEVLQNLAAGEDHNDDGLAWLEAPGRLIGRKGALLRPSAVLNLLRYQAGLDHSLVPRQNDSETGQSNTEGNLIVQGVYRVSWSGMLQTMGRCEGCLLALAGTPQRADWYKGWVHRWKSEACPRLAKWPEPPLSEYPLGDKDSCVVHEVAGGVLQNPESEARSTAELPPAFCSATVPE